MSLFTHEPIYFPNFWGPPYLTTYLFSDRSLSKLDCFSPSFTSQPPLLSSNFTPSIQTQQSYVQGTNHLWENNETVTELLVWLNYSELQSISLPLHFKSPVAWTMIWLIWHNSFFLKWLVEGWKCTQNIGRCLSEIFKVCSPIYI